MTILLPIRMALNIFPYWSKMASTRIAPLLSSSAKVRSRTLLTVEKAVSAEEKKADKSTRTPNEVSCMTPVVSNVVFTPCIFGCPPGFEILDMAHSMPKKPTCMGTRCVFQIMNRYKNIII